MTPKKPIKMEHDMTRVGTEGRYERWACSVCGRQLKVNWDTKDSVEEYQGEVEGVMHNLDSSNPNPDPGTAEHTSTQSWDESGW